MMAPATGLHARLASHSMSAILPPLDADAEQAELRDYLGDRYDEGRLRGHLQAMDEELERLGDEQRLYRSSDAYLYDLTVFAMSATKEPYLRTLTRLVPPPARLVDFGCGIGSDGLRLLAAGYSVAFADFDNPSVRYLRWRLARRGLDAEIYDLDQGAPPSGFDLAYSFDVIEHVPDPHRFLEDLERCADQVLVNLLEPEPGETALHHELPISSLLARARRRGLRHYRVHHGRSHLVLYRRDEVGGLARLPGTAAYWRGRALGSTAT